MYIDTQFALEFDIEVMVAFCPAYMHPPVNRTLSIVVDMRESPNVVHVNRTLSSVDVREIPTVVHGNSCYIKWSICAQFQLYVSVVYTCILMLYDPPGMEVSLGNQVGLRCFYSIYTSQKSCTRHASRHTRNLYASGTSNLRFGTASYTLYTI